MVLFKKWRKKRLIPKHILRAMVDDLAKELMANYSFTRFVQKDINRLTSFARLTLDKETDMHDIYYRSAAVLAGKLCYVTDKSYHTRLKAIEREYLKYSKLYKD